MIATIIGGTGLTGSLLVQHLLADPAITQVLSVSRRSMNVVNARLTEVLIPDLAQLPSVEPRLRGSIYFCCLGTTIKAAGSRENFERVDHDAIVAFAAIAKRHDARSFTLVSAMGADAGSMFFYNQVKGRTENDVKALGFRSLSVFRPGLLLGARSESRLAERIATMLLPLSRLLPAGVRKSVVTDAGVLARRMAGHGKDALAGVHVIAATHI